MLKWLAIYLVNVLVSTLGVFICGAFLLNVALHPFFSPGVIEALALKPYYPAELAIACFAGFWAGKKFAGTQPFWVWVPFVLYLGIGLLEWSGHQSVLAGGLVPLSAIQHFFGSNCFPDCGDQYAHTVPFYSSVAYSVCAVLERRIFKRCYRESQERVSL